ncbi:MAG: selenocysteine-specific translation elongation factor [Bacillota bacterium]
MIIGTAGHVDHGKTELIKALTGVDADRFIEEKERGVSIDIGFAPFSMVDGRIAGVIDVPGHERFIHNMLAGIGGIDLVLLVIDAQEGIMPQTREHLDILELLQIKKGLVVITKRDLVDTEWLEMVMEEVREFLENTFLAGASIYPVSSITGEGLAELRAAINALGDTVPERDEKAPLYMPLDRVFSISGFGTVVTGTLLTGTVKVGQVVEVLPPGRELRVRGIQVHGGMVDEAAAGQRVAVNVPGLERGEIGRGSVMAAPGYYHLTRFCDARLRLLPGARPLTNLIPVHFYLGTARVTARLLLLEGEEMAPGTEGFVQCRLDKPLVARRGDRFIVRSYSPMVTIGGGIILDDQPPRHRRFRPDVLARLEELEQEDPRPFVLQKLKGAGGATLAELSHLTHLGAEQLKEMLDTALQEGDVARLGDLYVTGETRTTWERQIGERLEQFHREKPLLPGMPKSLLGGFLPRKAAGRPYDALLEQLKHQGLVTIRGEIVAREDFSPRPAPGQEEKLQQLLAVLEKAGLNPLPTREMWTLLGLRKEEGEMLLDYLLWQERIVKVGEDFYLHKGVVERCLETLREHFRHNRSVTLGQYRDLLQGSRKSAQAILEYFDGCKYTRRIGDERVPLKFPGLG